MSKFTQLAKRHIVPAAAQAHDGLRLLFDIETDGLLLDKVTRVHCAVVVDLDSGQVDEYGPGQIAAALEHLSRASYLTGHNILDYDLRVLQHLHGWAPAAGCKILDTLIASRLILPHLSDLDDKAAATGDPKLGMCCAAATALRLGVPGSEFRRSVLTSRIGPHGRRRFRRDAWPTSPLTRRCGSSCSPTDTARGRWSSSTVPHRSAVGLQLTAYPSMRPQAHYLAAHDEGAYARTFLDGTDTHWKSATALGLTTESRDKQSALHTSLREGAKRFRYAFLYGCGAEKAGRIVNDTVRIAQQIDPGNGLQQKFFAGVAHPKAPALKRVGKTAITRFEAGTLGLKQLREKLGKHAGKFSWLPGLDGRRVPIRAQHTALNFIVTSSEAIICKRWLVLVHDELRQRFRYGWDGDVVLVLWIHDELVACCRPEVADQVGEIMVRLAVEPGEFYGFKAPLAAEYKVGPSWAGEIPAEEPLPEGAEEIARGGGAKSQKSRRKRAKETGAACRASRPIAPAAARAPQVAESPNTRAAGAVTGIDRERAAAMALMRWRKGLPPSPSGNGAASDKPKTQMRPHEIAAGARALRVRADMGELALDEERRGNGRKSRSGPMTPNCMPRAVTHGHGAPTPPH